MAAYRQQTRAEPKLAVVAAQAQGFHILGIDLLVDAAGALHLLEVNNSPSLMIDSVYPTEGPHAEEPPPLTPAREALIAPALKHIKRTTSKSGRPCTCKQHHRPHHHHPCAVDLVAKRAAVGGALAIVERDRRAQKASRPRPHAAELAEGTQYRPIL